MRTYQTTKRVFMTALVILCVSMGANAQLGKLVNKAKQKVKNKVENTVSDTQKDAKEKAKKEVSKAEEQAGEAAVRKLATKTFGKAPELPEIMAMKATSMEHDATDKAIKNYVWDLRTTPLNDVKKLAEKLTARAKWNREVVNAMKERSIPYNYEFDQELKGQLANWECLYGNLINMISIHNSARMTRKGDGWISDTNTLMISCTKASGVESSFKGVENLKTTVLFIRGKNDKGQFVNSSRQPRFLEEDELAAAKRDYNMMLNAAWLLEGYPVEWNQETASRSMKDHYAEYHQRALVYVTLLGDAIKGNSLDNLEFKAMPKAGSLNASLKAAALKISQQQNKQVVNVVITRNSWDIKKNALGTPICRVAYGYRIVQTKHGKMAVSCSWAQDYKGGGKYGSLRHYGVGTESFYVK
jgi:hypothetical protein